MSLALATLLPGLFLLALGLPLLLNHAGFVAALKALPRSTGAAVVFFGAGALWFLWAVLHLGPADFGEYRVWLAIGFAAVAVLSFKYAPDFLAVRGLCVLMLMSAVPLLAAAYMHYDQPQRLFMVTIVYIGVAVAIWWGASPYRMRDFLGWLFALPARTRAFGGALVAYGLLLAGISFTY